MNIQTGPSRQPVPKPPAKTGLWDRLPQGTDWREMTVNEVMVEIPQAAIELSNLRHNRPVAGGLAQSAVSGLAFLRAYQGLSGASLEQKLEGASSLALGVAGTLSLLPGQLAADASQAFMFGQAALELGLGLRELHEEIFVDKTPDWKEIATGALDTIKGASAFVPLFLPSAAEAAIHIQTGALLGKAALESTIRRSRDE